MKVIIPSGTELQGFEKDLQRVLEQANLSGYALMGFEIREAGRPQHHEMDALLIMEPGIFVCLEAKSYTGRWTGNANEKWFCDGIQITSVGTNPYKQVHRYSLVIKEKLRRYVFGDIDFWVNFFVVAPDGARIAIEGAVVNQFQRGKLVSICNLSKIEQTIGRITTNENVEQKVRELTLERIVEKILGDNISFESLNIINPNRVSVNSETISSNNQIPPETEELESPSPTVDTSSTDKNTVSDQPVDLPVESGDYSVSQDTATPNPPIETSLPGSHTDNCSGNNQTETDNNQTETEEPEGSRTTVDTSSTDENTVSDQPIDLPVESGDYSVSQDTVTPNPPIETSPPSAHTDNRFGNHQPETEELESPHTTVDTLSLNKDKVTRKSNVLLITSIGVIGILALGGLALIATNFWNERPCEISTQVRSQGTCYKDLSKNSLTIGILSSADQYTQLQSYLKKSLGNDVVDVVIDGGVDIKYQQAQDSVANKKWDIVFAYSPMNGMRAKDNGYQWAGKMFPTFPETYQSALFVKKNSSIQSIKDIKETTVVALGDFSSASSFYMPAFDLYGKSISVIMGNRSKKITELVATGKAEVGSVVYGGIKDNPLFRVIQLSREVPGTGVYLSPELSPEDRERIKTILINAPAEIKKEANYDVGEEPNYEGLRKISLRVDEVISCANFNKNPVNFFCGSKNSQQPTGKISGFTIEKADSVILRLANGQNQDCRLVVSLKTLSQVPGGTSPGTINHKSVYVDGLDGKQFKNPSCQMNIVDPKQVTVLDSSN